MDDINDMESGLKLGKPISAQEAIRLIDLLKKCREEIAYLNDRILFEDRDIEQRTKQVCFEAGWEWISETQDFEFDKTSLVVVEYYKDSFKRAIELAEVKE